MQEFQERVVEEKQELQELDEKINKLEEFIAENETFPTLARIEQKRLKQQLRVMQEYAGILSKRIATFA